MHENKAWVDLGSYSSLPTCWMALALLNFLNFSFFIYRMRMMIMLHRVAMKAKKGPACKATGPW